MFCSWSAKIEITSSLSGRQISQVTGGLFPPDSPSEVFSLEPKAWNISPAGRRFAPTLSPLFLTTFYRKCLVFYQINRKKKSKHTYKSLSCFKNEQKTH